MTRYQERQETVEADPKMAQMFDLQLKNFKTIMINIIQYLVRKVTICVPNFFRNMDTKTQNGNAKYKTYDIQ